MKTDEEIGREVLNICFHWGRVWTQERCAEVGEAARKAVGERPRMMIEGMTVRDIALEMRMENAAHDKESISTRCARVAHRLANTPVPVVDPDALAKKIAWRHASTSRITNCQNDANGYWLTLSGRDQVGWRAVAKMMEERK